MAVVFFPPAPVSSADLAANPLYAPVGLSSPARYPCRDSNFIQVIRSKTAKGMVPNFSAGGSKSLDRSEPPIGAKVMLEMYKKYNDTWLVELLYDDLVAWNSWFVAERMLGPLGLVSLGSDTIDGYTDFAPGTMQGARFESGLDNSPMYDGEFFEPNLKQDGSYKIGQMTLCRDSDTCLLGSFSSGSNRQILLR